MSLRQLVEQAERMLDTLPPLPNPFSVEAYLAVLEESRGRPIMLRPLARGAVDLPCGLWIDMGGFDLICYANEASPLLRNAIQLHEIAHMLYGHQGAMDEEILFAALPDIPRKLIRARLSGGASRGRTSYTTEEEREAEILATVIAEAAERAVSFDPVLASLVDSLGHPIRRRKKR